MISSPETYIGVINFLTLGVSVIAAVLAIDMYGLLRIGQFGQTWRVLIVASVLFVLIQVLGLSTMLLHLEVTDELEQIAELIFAIALAYAFYSQRALYSGKLKERDDESDTESDDD